MPPAARQPDFAAAPAAAQSVVTVTKFSAAAADVDDDDSRDDAIASLTCCSCICCRLLPQAPPRVARMLAPAKRIPQQPFAFAAFGSDDARLKPYFASQAHAASKSSARQDFLTVLHGCKYALRTPSRTCFRRFSRRRSDLMSWDSCLARVPQAPSISANIKTPKSWYLPQFCHTLRSLLLTVGATAGCHQNGQAHAEESLARQRVRARGASAPSLLSSCHPPSLLFSQVNALKQLSHNNLLRLESIFRDDEHDCM